MGGSFFQTIPSSGSFTRSSVNNEAGAQSGPVRDKITQAGMVGMVELLGVKSQFLNIDQAIIHFKSLGNGMEKGWTPDVLQTNFGKKRNDS